MSIESFKTAGEQFYAIRLADGTRGRIFSTKRAAESFLRRIRETAK